MTAASVLFLGLATYSRVGGLQNFNRRVIANLGALTKDGTLTAVDAHLMDDTDQCLPLVDGVRMRGFGRDRAKMLGRSIQASRGTDILMVGHINLLPVAWLLRLLRPGLRTVLFVHGDEVWNDVRRPKRAWEPWMLRSIDRIASVSAYTGRIMGEQFAVRPDRVVVFPNAVDDFPPPPPRSDRGRRILCVTRMGDGDRRKNVHELVRAVALLRDTGRDATLTLVGDGTLRAEIEALVKTLGSADQVHFAGKVSNDELSRLYGAADVFALPSSKEGFGIVYLEAWSHGLPVLCGSRGAPHEIIDDGVDGRIADEDDIADLAEKLDDLLTRPDAPEMGQRGLRKVRDRYLNANAIENLRRLVVTA